MNPIIALARWIPVGLLPLALSAAMLMTGCRSPHGQVSNRMASIIVTNRSSEQIEAAIQAVFEKHAYEAGKSVDDELVFEKKGTFMNGLVYGDWYSGGVWERFKVYQRELRPVETVVECDAYMVQEREDPLFQKERKEYKTRRGHCQKLLNEVAKHLMSKANTVAPRGSP
jgi:hypothetical protein